MASYPQLLAISIEVIRTNVTKKGAVVDCLKRARSRVTLFTNLLKIDILTLVE